MISQRAHSSQFLLSEMRVFVNLQKENEYRFASVPRREEAIPFHTVDPPKSTVQRKNLYSSLRYQPSAQTALFLQQEGQHCPDHKLTS